LNFATGLLANTSEIPSNSKSTKRFASIGFPHETYFVGRNDKIAELQDNHSNERIKVAVISGLRGPEEAVNLSIVQQTSRFDQFPGPSKGMPPNTFGSSFAEDGQAKDPSYSEALKKLDLTKQIKNISMSESRAIKWSSVGKGIFYNPQIIIGNGRSSNVFEGKTDIRSQPLSDLF
jgi:hypothetical protein